VAAVATVAERGDVAGMKYIVILEVRAGGSPCGSTEDPIEADSAKKAETKAIALWRAVRPDRTFSPLLTLASTTEGETS
jgi:hypothetical protein